MIDPRPSWHLVDMRLRSLLLPLPLVVLPVVMFACDADDDDDPEALTCEPAEAGVSSTYSITLEGFPEIEGNELQATMYFEGNCTVEALGHAAGELTMSLACEHPAPSSPDGARVTLTTDAPGIPAGLAEGDTLTFNVYAVYFEETGGDQQGEGWRALTLADSERYALTDDLGVVFGANVNSLSAAYETVTITSDANCSGWAPCGGDINGPLRGYIRAETDDESVDVQVGEVQSLVGADASWDVSLFQSRLVNDCHQAEFGGFSIVRRPA